MDNTSNQIQNIAQTQITRLQKILTQLKNTEPKIFNENNNLNKQILDQVDKLKQLVDNWLKPKQES